MRKPKMLRVRGTYFGLTIFDMASDGSHFTLVIPIKNTAIEGSSTVTEKRQIRWRIFVPTFSSMRLLCAAWTPTMNSWYFRYRDG